MAVIPSIVIATIAPLNYRLRALPDIPGPAILIDSGETDSGSTPTWRFRPGNVLVKDSSTGRYYSANNASNGDRNGQASVTAAVTADGSWASKTYTFTIDGVAIVTVTAGGGDNSDTLIAAAFNGNAIFAANLVASVVASRVVVKTLRGRRDQVLKVTSNYATAFGASGTEAKGSDADYLILVGDHVDLKDNAGAAVHGLGASAYAGFWNTSALVNLTKDAQSALERKGSIFG